MKRTNEKPPNMVMRYFTPELYRRYNSPDADEADRANADWEQAITAYQRHYKKISKGMPTEVRRLGALNLHDAEVLWPWFLYQCQHPQQVGPPRYMVVPTRRDGQSVDIFYLLPKRADAVASGPNEWPFSKQRQHWLYDELDIDETASGRYVHRILFSDGTAVEIPFEQVNIFEQPLPDRPQPRALLRTR